MSYVFSIKSSKETSQGEASFIIAYYYYFINTIKVVVLLTSEHGNLVSYFICVCVFSLTLLFFFSTMYVLLLSRCCWLDSHKDYQSRSFKECCKEETSGAVLTCTQICKYFAYSNFHSYDTFRHFKLSLSSIQKMRPPKEWGEQEIAQLQELYDQLRDSASKFQSIIN